MVPTSLSHLSLTVVSGFESLLAENPENGFSRFMSKIIRGLHVYFQNEAGDSDDSEEDEAYNPTDEESGEEESSDDYSEEESDWSGEEDESGKY